MIQWQMPSQWQKHLCRRRWKTRSISLQRAKREGRWNCPAVMAWSFRGHPDLERAIPYRGGWNRIRSEVSLIPLLQREPSARNAGSTQPLMRSCGARRTAPILIQLPPTSIKQTSGSMWQWLWTAVRRGRQPERWQGPSIKMEKRSAGAMWRRVLWQTAARSSTSV